MTNFEVPEPILNSPFEEPREHWHIQEGKPPDRRPGRRPAGYFYRDPAAPPVEGEHEARGEWVALDTPNLIRERVAAWRDEGWPGVTRTTLELLHLLASRRPRAAALLCPARGRRDRHLFERGAAGLPARH